MADGTDPAAEPEPPAGKKDEPSGIGGLMTLVRSSPANAMMFLLRLGVLFYAIAFVSQLMNTYRAFRRCMACYLGASAIRTYQRRPAVDSVMELVKGPKSFSLFMEDAMHNVIYAVIMLPSPLSSISILAMMSPAIFAFFQSASYMDSVFKYGFPSRHMYLGQMLNRVASKEKAQSGFAMAAKGEVFLLFVMLFQGATSLSINGVMRALLYGQFCVLRAVSKRNPFPRQAWYNLRLVVEQVSEHPRFPGFIRAQLVKMFAKVDEMSFQLNQVLAAAKQQEQQAH